MTQHEAVQPGCPCRACGRTNLRLVGITPDGTWCQCPACRRIWRCEKCSVYAPYKNAAITTAHKRQS